ncbi:MAG: hypothetical protein J0H07_21940 [Sphingobacteriales bacterium]|nr:hypothetical protein [Sphingobacteriales bacterium]
MIYIVGAISLIAISNKRFHTRILPEVPGDYVYELNDSIRASFSLHKDNTFTFYNGQTTVNGFWSIDNSRLIKFYDLNKKQTGYTTWIDSGAKKTIVFMQDGKRIDMVKRNQ